MNTKPLVKEIIRFGVVGVVATVLHYGIYYFLKAITNVNVAYAIGYATRNLSNVLRPFLPVSSTKGSFRK